MTPKLSGNSSDVRGFPKFSIYELSTDTHTVNKVNKARVLLFEDEPEVLNHLRAGLDADAFVECYTSSNYRGFVELVRSTDIYAASIDWQIHGVDKGPEALQLLRNVQPWAARIVYTRYDNREVEARDLHADFFLYKDAKSQTEHEQFMRKGIQLGLTRYIHHHLRENGETNLPVIPHSGPLPEALEEQIFVIAQQRLLRLQNDGEDADKLLELMIQRGWWHDIKDEKNAHLSNTELKSYNERTMNALSHEIVKAHLEVCLLCKAEAYDLLTAKIEEGRVHKKLKKTNNVSRKGKSKAKHKKLKILATYKGWVDQVDDGIAYLTLIDEKERTVEAKYDAERLKKKHSIVKGSYFICSLVEPEDDDSTIDNFVRFELETEPPPDAEVARRSVAALEDKYKDYPIEDSEDEIIAGINGS